MRNVLKNRPDVARSQLERTRRLMNQINDDVLVTGHDRHIASLSLPDPNDRHVLAAAIEARAQVIVTFNLSDFPASALRQYSIRAIHRDAYLVSLISDVQPLFLTAVRDHRMSLNRPPKSAVEYIETMTVNHLPKLARRLTELADAI